MVTLPVIYIYIKKEVNSIPTDCGVTYESVCSLARGHMIRVWGSVMGWIGGEAVGIVISVWGEGQGEYYGYNYQRGS